MDLHSPIGHPPSDSLSPGALSLSAEGFRLRHLFPTPILLAPVNEAEWLNAQLTGAVLARAARAGAIPAGQDGTDPDAGWQSGDDAADWCGEAGRLLLESATGLVNTVTALHGPDGAPLQGRPAWRVNAWARITGPGHASPAHHHPGAFWSGVYWVDAGNGPGGELEIQDPRGVLPGFFAPALRMAIPGCLSAGRSDFIEPRAGVMAIFPAWMVHGTRRHAGTRPRISIGFNFSV